MVVADPVDFDVEGKVWIDELRERIETLKCGLNRLMEKAERTKAPRWTPAPKMITFAMEDMFNSLSKY